MVAFSNGIFDVIFKHKQRQRIILETEILLRSLSPNEPPRLAKKASKFQEKKTPPKGLIPLWTKSEHTGPNQAHERYCLKLLFAH